MKIEEGDKVLCKIFGKLIIGYAHVCNYCDTPAIYIINNTTVGLKCEEHHDSLNYYDDNRNIMRHSYVVLKPTSSDKYNRNYDNIQVLAKAINNSDKSIMYI